jgi:hypothetical protein
MVSHRLHRHQVSCDSFDKRPGNASSSVGTMSRDKLLSALQDIHAKALVRQAETIRDWPACDARHEQAEIHVRLALWEQQIGRITEEVLQRIYSALDFVMPDDGAFADDTMPLAELEKATESELAFHEQLARRQCDECGDGVCSTIGE